MQKKISLIILFLLSEYFAFSQGNINVYPKNDYWISKDTTIFIWDKIVDGISFELFISSTNTFTDTVYYSGVLTINTDTVVGISKGTYYWRIKTNLIGGGIDESSGFKFTVFEPNSISNLGLWLKPNEGFSFSVNKITGWADQSGSLNNASQIDTNFSPELSNVDLNGYSPLQFDGVNDYLLLDDSLENPFNLFFLVDLDSVGVTGSLFSDVIHDDGLIYYFYPEQIALWRGGQRVYSPFKSGDNFYNISHQTTALDFYKNSVPMSLAGTGIIYDIKIKRIGASTFKPFEGRIYEIIGFNGNITAAETDSVNNYLRYKYAPPINLGSNIYRTNYCDTVLYAGKRFTNYQWQDSSNSDSLIVTETGWYSVTATDIFGFQSTDSIFVQFPDINQLTNDTICQGSSLLWNTNLSDSIFNFEWSNASTDSLLNIPQPGDYWVKVTDSLGCFRYSDTITITLDSFPTQTSLGIDKTVCQGENIGLETGVGAISYLWNTNDTTAQITIDTAGMYWVQVENNNGCVANDTVQIAVNGIAPTVLFNAINACNNSPTLFNNTSFTTDGSNIINSFWTFGTGDTSNLQNPTYNYLATGNYNVTLQIQTDSGCSNSITQQIQVHKKPTAGFFPTNSLMCSSQNSFFTENSFSTDGIINNWLWDFGTTSISDTSSLQNGSYDYVIAGNYSVQLIVSTEFGCSDTVLNLINVKPSPIANFVFQDSCLTNQTKFTNLSTGTISMTNWDFGDANSSALLNPSHVYANSGSYNVILAIKATNGCWDTLIKPVGIYDNPIANFVTDDYCVLSNNQLFDSSITNAGVLTNWLWDISSLSFQSTNQNPMINFNFGDSGLFQLKLKVTNNYGCIDSITKTIGVYPLPIPNFNFSPEIGLPPLQVNFNNLTYGGSSTYWNFGDGNSSIDISPTYTYQDLGVFTVTLYSTSPYGCVDSISKTIQITEPVIDLAVKNIYYEFVPNSNFMKISVQLANEGRVTIQNMDLILQNSSTGNILESWSGSLAPNMQNIYTFSSMIEMPNGEIPSLICVTATNINYGIDANLSNNEFCKTLSKFELINLYPNPTSKNLFLEFISPQQSDLEINLFNNLGKLVSTLFKGQSSKGINRLNFLMSIYAQGIYVIEIKNQDEIIRKKFMIN